ncbi:MAG: DUF2752 domain-containing protein [Acidobacteriota bacterium]
MRRVAHWSRSSGWLFAALTAGLLIVGALPATWLDTGPSVCLWRLVGLSACPGCGMSRALWHALHGDLGGAVAFNWRVVVVGPLLAFLYLRLGVRTLRRGER